MECIFFLKVNLCRKSLRLWPWIKLVILFASFTSILNLCWWIKCSVGKWFSFVCRSLLPVLQKLVKLGTPKQAKHAIRCIHALYDNKDDIYQQIFEVSSHLISVIRSSKVKCNPQLWVWCCSKYYGVLLMDLTWRCLILETCSYQHCTKFQKYATTCS